MAILVFTCPFGERSIINKWKIKKRNDQDEKGIPKTTFAANALTFTAENDAISPNFLESKFCGKKRCS